MQALAPWLFNLQELMTLNQQKKTIFIPISISIPLPIPIPIPFRMVVSSLLSTIIDRNRRITVQEVHSLNNELRSTVWERDVATATL